MRKLKIRIVADDMELTKEGYPEGSVVTAEVDRYGKAWLNRAGLFSGNCVAYIGINCEIVRNTAS